MFNANIPIYSVIILIALMSNVIVVFLSYNRKTFTKDEIIGAIIYENIGMIIGAKFLSYLQNPSMEFDFLKLGLSSFGGIIGAIIFLIIFDVQFKKGLKNLFLTFMPPIPLVYSIGKIGCFLVGCCYGIKYKGIGHITYKYSLVAPNNVSLFPVQLVETIVFTFIFIYIIYHIRKKQYNLKQLSMTIILCSLAKFLLDFFRYGHQKTLITLNQMICIVFFIIGIIIYFKNNNKINLINLIKH